MIIWIATFYVCCLSIANNTISFHIISSLYLFDFYHHTQASKLYLFYLPIINNMLSYFLFLLSFVTCQVPPTWVTSPYVRAASNRVISTLTGSASTPAYTFTFSSPFSTLPNIAYGINKYIGKLNVIQAMMGFRYKYGK